MTLPRLKPLSRYGAIPWLKKAFLHARWNRTPYEVMAGFMPVQGKILDLASGHGLLSLTLALQSDERKVLGLDHDEARVACAQFAQKGLLNLSFVAGDIAGDWAEMNGSLWDGIALIDSMHYFSFLEQERLLEKVVRALSKDGVFLLREVDRAAGGFFMINRLHEQVMTRFGFTKADGLCFRSRFDWIQLLMKHGFSVDVSKCSRFPFADLLFVCRLEQVNE